MSALCDIDQRPATMGNLCSSCVTSLHTTVLSMPRLLRELDVTITKQARQTSAAGGACNERPLVLNIAASEVADEVRVALRTVAHLGAGEHERVPVAIEDLAPWTARHLAHAARRPEIAGAVADLMAAVERGWRAVDRAPDRRVIGACDCGGVLATHRTEGEVSCPSCGVLWEIEERVQARDEMLLGLVVGTADLVTIFRSVLKVRLTSETVRQWVRRQQLHPVSVDPMMFRATDAVATWRRLHGHEASQDGTRAGDAA